MSRSSQRLFLALWPDPKLRTVLHAYAQQLQRVFGGRMVAKDNIHLTLVFIGSLSLDRIDGLRKIIGSLRAQRFELDLARAGCWKRSQIGWLAPETVPTSLDMLVSQLRNSLSGARIHFDDKPFFPHVTLIRKAKCKSKADPPSIRLGWSVDRFSLVHARTLSSGPVYETIDEWPMK